MLELDTKTGELCSKKMGQSIVLIPMPVGATTAGLRGLAPRVDGRLTARPATIWTQPACATTQRAALLRTNPISFTFWQDMSPTFPLDGRLVSDSPLR